MDRSEISRIFTVLARKHRVPGAQLVVAHGDEVSAFEFGHERCGAGRAMSDAAKVPIGSITKAFTAALALCLVSDGDLELDTPITEYLPEPRRAARGLPAVTLRQLLSHTAGLPASSEPAGRPPRSARRRMLDDCRGLVPLAPPGTAFSYSNVGYVLAGHLVEVVTGMTWWEAMEAILLKPLGIAPAFVVSPSPAPNQQLVTGHSVNPAVDRIRPVEQSLPIADAPAGALAASASDLVAFGRMLVTGDDDLIDPALLVEMRQPAPGAEPFGLADGWGLGLAVFHTVDGTWWGHDGTADGTACHLRICPERDIVVGLTTNANTGFAMWDELSARLFSPGLAVGARRTGTDARHRMAPPPDCAGRYRNGDVEYTVTGSGRDCRLIVDGEPFAELSCYPNLEFEVRDTGDEHPQQGRFLRDPRTGRIDTVQVSGRLARRTRQDADEQAA